jgi:pyridoxal phosphate enzyme (YggS family)
MESLNEPFAERLARVRRRIERAAARAGRDPSAVTLVLVTKEAPDSIFEAARAAGVRDVGESRVQQAELRHEGRADGFRWHLVGHLQSNKARRAVRVFDVLHGIDSIALLQRVDEAAVAFDRRPEVLLQVNVSGEASKHGFTPEELPAALQTATGLSHARVTGLMTMAPEAEDPQAARPHFRALVALGQRHSRPGAALSQFSMGMSDDFEVAVEEGATLIRVGRLLVRPEAPGPRDARAVPQ